MNTILIAGAGQLGSRHLQGVKTSLHESDIWVFDLSEESLKIAEERYNQVETSVAKTVHFVSDLNLVPLDIDVVIVATGSKPRAAIIKNILMSRNVKYMVLEKFLFPCLSEYDEIAKLLENKNVKTWVNCPRRMWEGYELITKYIDTKYPIKFEYNDSNWGLCCNSVHYIDIFMKLTGANTYSINIDGLIPDVIDSKRPGYVELNGTEVFTTSDGSTLTLRCTMDDVANSFVSILNGETKIIYNEGCGKIEINGDMYEVKVHYQSGLSGILVDELIETGSCRLSTYVDSASYHVGYLTVIAPFINKIKGWESDFCPIT